MWLRETRKEFKQLKDEGNRRAMRTIVNGGEGPGLLAYDGYKPVEWCEVEPRKPISLCGGPVPSSLLMPMQEGEDRSWIGVRRLSGGRFSGGVSFTLET